MKTILIFFFITTSCLYGFSQKKQDSRKTGAVTSGKAIWKKGARVSLFIGQAGSKNWASGSDVFSLSANAFLNAYANRGRGRWFFNNLFIASYGFINSDEYSTIKDDDKIDFFSTVGMNFKKKPKFGLAAAFNFRSQFSNGYERNYLNQGIKRRTSGFFAPAYITLAPLGMSYQEKSFDFYISPVAIRGVIVSSRPYSYSFQGGIIPVNMVNEKNPAIQEKSVAEMYGVNPNKTIQYQVGPYLSASYNSEICKNIIYSARLDLFSDFTHSAAENVDVFWTNTFYLRVNRWLNAVYSIDLAYDDDIKKFGYFKNHPAMQARSILGLGVTAHFGGNKEMHKRMRQLTAE